MSLLLQYLLIGIVVVASLFYMVRKLMPKSNAGCDSGCNSCHGCSTSAPPDEQPLIFHKR